MSQLKIERQCKSCDGSGLYEGMAEKSGAAIVCHTCRGTGKEVISIDNTPFTGRKDKRGIKRVYECNPGIGIGDGNGHTFEEFGGMPYKEWAQGMKFPKGSEMRKYTCPAWWYQTANYDKKPNWDDCMGAGSFSSCKYFPNKIKCWERFDKEEGRC